MCACGPVCMSFKCMYTCYVPRMHVCPWACVCVGAINWQIMSWQRWYSCSEHGLCHPLVPAVGTHDYIVAASGLTRERWQGCGHKCHIPGAGPVQGFMSLGGQTRLGLRPESQFLQLLWLQVPLGRGSGGIETSSTLGGLGGLGIPPEEWASSPQFIVEWGALSG